MPQWQAFIWRVCFETLPSPYSFHSGNDATTPPEAQAPRGPSGPKSVNLPSVPPRRHDLWGTRAPGGRPARRCARCRPLGAACKHVSCCRRCVRYIGEIDTKGFAAKADLVIDALRMVHKEHALGDAKTALEKALKSVEGAEKGLRQANEPGDQPMEVSLYTSTYVWALLSPK